MSFASHIAKSLLFLAVLGAAVAQPPKPEDAVQNGSKDLTPTRLPDESQLKGTPVPRAYALVIGIAKYEKLDPSEFLRFTETDADAIYRALISKEGGAFPAENVHRLVGPQATLSNLRHEFEQWLPSVANQPNDRVVVYFSGHGFIKNGHGYLAPWDVDASRPDSTAYPMDLLGNILARTVKAQSKLLLIDACHAGKITSETTDEGVLAQLNQLPKTLLTVTATRAAERSYEDPKLSTGFGVFTYFLVQGLLGNADNDPCDGVITADELVEYVRGEVRSYARARGALQTPRDQGDLDYRKIILAAHPACIGNSQTSGGPPLGSIVIESNMDKVDVYLDDNFVGKVGTNSPLMLPGLSTGIHIIRGEREGYEPDTKQELVIRGQQHTVTLRILYRREYKRSAAQLLQNGERLLFRPTSLEDSLDATKVYLPAPQTKAELLRARAFFMQALKQEPDYARAAYDLAQTCNLLWDDEAMLEAFRQAIRINHDYVDARIDYAGVLIEVGDPDEAIRQLLEAVRLDPQRDLAYSHLSRAYLDKGLLSNAIEAADKALALRPGNEQASLWKAEALRRSAATQNDLASQRKIYSQAVDNYEAYVELTNFSIPLYRRIAYWGGLGLGGVKSRPDRQLSYIYQRSIAFIGQCECQDMLGNRKRAIESCEKGIRYDPKDAVGYFMLGNVYSDLFNQVPRREYLVSARSNYVRVLHLNPKFEQAPHVKGYIENIDIFLAKLSK